MKIAVMLPNWIGDVVMATPTLRALRKHFAGRATITGIMRPYVSKILAGTPWLDAKIYYDHRSKDTDLQVRSLVPCLREMQLDSIILMTNSFRGAGIAWLSGARRRYGYVRYGRGMCLTDKLYPPRYRRTFIPVSAVDYYLDLAYAIGCPPESRRLELATSPHDESGADRVWENLDLAKARHVVVLNTGAARGSAKHWPAENYIELAHEIVGDPQNAVLIICGPAERESAARIERVADHPRIRSMANENLAIGVDKACIRRSRLMVTTDSGPRHIATAFDVPVVAMFGPIDPRWSETYHAKSINLLHPVPCGPCGRRVCPFEHHRCMRELTVEKVYASVIKMLEQTEKRVAIAA